MKITKTPNYSSPVGIGWSHHGIRLKRKLGGPPWWHYLNGFRISTRRVTFWVELRKAHRRGKLYQDRTWKREAKFT